MNNAKSWLLYSAIRVILFAAVFTVLRLLAIEWWLCALLAALVSACISYIFFQKPRDELSRSLYELRHRETEPAREDDEIEDAALDRFESERQSRHDAEREGGRQGERQGERDATA